MIVGHSAKIQRDVCRVTAECNTRVVSLPPPSTYIRIPRAQIPIRISAVMSKVSRFRQCIEANSGMLRPVRLRLLCSTRFPVRLITDFLIRPEAI